MRYAFARTPHADTLSKRSIMKALLCGFVLSAALAVEVFAADAPEVIAARDYVYCAALYTLLASSPKVQVKGAEAEKKRRTDLAIEFGDWATILTNSEFFAKEYKSTHARILDELKSNPALPEYANRAYALCSQANEKYDALLSAQIKRRNEQIKKRLQ